MKPRPVVGRQATWCWLCHADWEARRSTPEARAKLYQRFDAKVEKADGCWEWTGARSDRGYGCIGAEGKTCYAHRIAYERQFGPIPEGLDIGHRCRNRACVNPHHLEAVSRSASLAEKSSRVEDELRPGPPLL
jgi:HNH endonuclease